MTPPIKTLTLKAKPSASATNADQNTDRKIQAPEFALIKIVGPRNQMHHLKLSELALHVDVSDFKDGDHEIILNSSNLFLPETLKLVELIPAAISCNISTT